MWESIFKYLCEVFRYLSYFFIANYSCLKSEVLLVLFFLEFGNANMFLQVILSAAGEIAKWDLFKVFWYNKMPTWTSGLCFGNQLLQRVTILYAQIVNRYKMMTNKLAQIVLWMFFVLLDKRVKYWHQRI